MIEQEVDTEVTLSTTEEAKIARILQAMNASADETIDRLDRIHLLLQDINTELRGISSGVSLPLENRLAALTQVRGIWQDRQDLPELSELRNEWNRP